ncbi:N-acetyl sugar amidotransferase [Candidatus Berkiella cookevillensis]|uniref:N-acetyl sugar amidotransferase n=1 Tax=Candidatus Berkiella cookevillensis TaxID=437022 RepID=A0A0Q9YGL6_9GAMM|nr:N-acetyl sugar amidotransferase [Candidatus Berkiella cookevillensis]MCS5707692.1 N-acetyl sugar amidotransferase [Candidatus Berkiella cookevillensis]
MKYCQRCIMPATRPGLRLNAEGICAACLWYEQKKTLNWQEKHKEFQDLAQWAKATSRSPWDCVLGVSGGKDSTWQAIVLREQFNLNPLLVQFASSDGTELGRYNIENLVKLDFDLITIQPNPQIAQKLSKRSFLEYGNIHKYAELALFSAPFRVAIDYDIPLVFFGENPALEAGDQNSGEGFDATKIINNNTLGGQSYRMWLEKDEVEEKDLQLYRFPTEDEFHRWQGKGIFMGYYLNWSGWENGIFAIEHGMKCIEADYKDIGIHYKHNSLDSDNGGIVNSMLKQTKLGFGNATEFACYDIRAGRISREEGALLAKLLDGKCHPRYISAYCDWINISENLFWETVKKFRGPMWRQEGAAWIITDPIWKQVNCPEDKYLETIIHKLDTQKKRTQDDSLVGIV